VIQPEAGDVLLVARIREASWVSHVIQKFTASWYSHALVALGDGRFAHAFPGKDKAVEILGSDQSLRRLITWGSVYDLYRPDRSVDSPALWDSVNMFDSESLRFRQVRTNPCERISREFGYIFSDGDLLALLFLRLCQRSRFAEGAFCRRLIESIVTAVEDAQGRLFCSGFVHRALDAAGARPIAPPAADAFVDLSDFKTDEPMLATMGPARLYEWLVQKLFELTDLDPNSLPTCVQVAAAVTCHMLRGTPVPEPLHMANFMTPADLGISPSLTKIASRYRRPNGDVTPWEEALRLPPPGIQPE
jgi:hypothetical protein